MLEGKRLVVGKEYCASDRSLYLFEHTTIVGVEDACQHLTLLDMRTGSSYTIEDSCTSRNDIQKIKLIQYN